MDYQRSSELMQAFRNRFSRFFSLMNYRDNFIDIEKFGLFDQNMQETFTLFSVKRLLVHLVCLRVQIIFQFHHLLRSITVLEIPRFFKNLPTLFKQYSRQSIF